MESNVAFTRGESVDTKTITYQELLDEVSKFANVLKNSLKRN